VGRDGVGGRGEGRRVGFFDVDFRVSLDDRLPIDITGKDEGTALDTFLSDRTSIECNAVTSDVKSLE
jgi:hypothetical protein